jgi:hypothetical protein
LPAGETWKNQAEPRAPDHPTPEITCMSRSRVLIAFLAALLVALTARSASAQNDTVFDLIGSVDYTHGRSIVKVGSWVSYRVTTSNDKGVTDDCTVTIMIGGEEEWWGEECFWVETTTQRSKMDIVTAATLMSSAIFEDSVPLRNVMLYQRKRIAELDNNGQPVQQTVRRGPAAIKARVTPNPGLTTLVDTLGVDTLKTVQGDFACLKVRTEKGVISTSQSADSSQYGETREVRVFHLTPQIPVTGTAHGEVDLSTSRRTWPTGHSDQSTPLILTDRTKTVLELVAYGTQGRNAELVPEEFRRSLAEQRAAPVPRRKAPAVKPGSLARCGPGPAPARCGNESARKPHPPRSRDQQARSRTSYGTIRRCHGVNCSLVMGIRVPPGGGLLEQAAGERLGVERLPVVQPLADPDHADGQPQLVHDGEHGTAPGGPVEFGERQAGYRQRPLEFTGLLQAVLTQRGVQHQQDVVRRAGNDAGADAPHLLQLVHQVVLGVQASRGVHQYDLGAAREGSTEGVVHHG